MEIVKTDAIRERGVDYMVIPQGTDEREPIELFNDMDWLERAHLLEYARKAKKRAFSLDMLTGPKKIHGEDSRIL